MRAAKAQLRHEHNIIEQGAIKKATAVIHEEIKLLSMHFGKSEAYFEKQLGYQVRSDKQKRQKTSIFNALLSDLAEKENKGMYLIFISLHTLS